MVFLYKWTRGRIGRLEMLTYTSVFIGTAFMLILQKPQNTLGMQLVGLIVTLLCYLVLAFVSIRRFHDLGRPGNRALTLLIPLFNLYVLGELLLRRGAKGANNWGQTKQLSDGTRNIYLGVIAIMVVMMAQYGITVWRLFHQ